MSSNVMGMLIRKDLYLCRGVIVAGIVGGLIATAIATSGPKGFAIGGIAFMTSLIASGIFFAMFVIITERKERSILFALSLPISNTQYQRAKLFAVLLGYFIPWSVLSLAAVAYVNIPGVPGGLTPYVLVILAYFLTLQTSMVAFLFSITSEHVAGLGIVVFNLSISFFMMYLNIMSPVGRHARDAVAQWSPAFFTILAVELAVSGLAVVIAIFAQSRTRDIL